MVDKDFKDYRRRVGVEYSKYDEDVRELKEQLGEEGRTTQKTASKEIEFEPISLAKEGVVHERESSMPPPR